MKPSNIKRYEIIGNHAEVVDSSNKSDIGINGKIIDETKNTFIIETSKGEKILFKKNLKVKMKINNKNALVDCKIFLGRPEERLKK